MRRARGNTLIEAMVAIAILGLGGRLALEQVQEVRKGTAVARRAAQGLSCAQAELERLRLEPVATLQRRVGELPAPERCEAPRPRLRLLPAEGAGVPEGTFVLQVEVPSTPVLTHTVELPFVAVPAGGAP